MRLSESSGDSVVTAAQVRLAEAQERLARLYEATDKKDDEAKWRKELDAINATEKKGEKQP